MAGIVLAAVQVEQPAALLDTAYGQVFLIKLALLVDLFLLAAINRWSLSGSTEAGDPAAARKLARSIAVETLGVWSRSVGESVKMLLHSGRSYGTDTSRQRHDHVRHPSGNTAIEGSAQRTSRATRP